MNTYIEENRNFITASKLKDFIKSPELFYVKYIKEVDIDETKDYYIIWTAFDDYFSYWEKAFYEKYFIDEWLTIPKLQEILDESWVEYKKSWKKDIFMDLAYWDWNNKIKLTKSQWETILWMIEEAKRQPLFDEKWKYKKQYVVTGQYTWATCWYILKLRAKLDRINLTKKWIRDYKTTWDMEKLKRELIYASQIDNIDADAENFNTIWAWYFFSMSFYLTLIKIQIWEEFEVFLDIFTREPSHASYFVKLNNETLKRYVEELIKPALNLLAEYMRKYEETWDESIWSKKLENFSENKLLKSPYYSYLSSTIQEKFDNL